MGVFRYGIKSMELAETISISNDGRLRVYWRFLVQFHLARERELYCSVYQSIIVEIAEMSMK